MKKHRSKSDRSDATARNGRGTELPSKRTRQPTQPTEPDLPPLSEEDQAALADFAQRQQVLRDLTIGCVAGNHTGAYIFGPPGTSKNFTILKTLREQMAYWRQHQRITAKPLFFEMERHPGAVHVIDDCEQLFSEKSALTLLRAALGGERVNGRRERRVSYSVSGSRARELSFYFFGSIIFTANRGPAEERPEIRGVMSRIPYVGHSPPDREIRAVMRHVARLGHVGEAGSMTPQECVEVVEHVIRVASDLECRLDLRWVEHGYGHYLTHVVNGGEVDWRDMTKFHIMNTLTFFDHTPSSRAGQAMPGAEQGDSFAQEIAIAREIAQMPGLTRDERLRIWEERTKLSRATYYRRLEAGRSDPGAG